MTTDEIRPMGEFSSPEAYGRYLDTVVDQFLQAPGAADAESWAPVSVRVQVTADRFPEQGQNTYGGFRQAVVVEAREVEGRGPTRVAGFEFDIPLCAGGFDLLMTKYLRRGEEVPVDLEIGGAGSYRIWDRVSETKPTLSQQYAVAYRPADQPDRGRYGIGCFRVRAVCDEGTSFGPWSPYLVSEISPGVRYEFSSGGAFDGCEEWYCRLTPYFDEAVRAFSRVGVPVGRFACTSRKRADEEAPLLGLPGAEIFDQLMKSPDDKVQRAARRILLRLPERNPWREQALDTRRGWEDDRLY